MKFIMQILLLNTNPLKVKEDIRNRYICQGNAIRLMEFIMQISLLNTNPLLWKDTYQWIQEIEN